MKRILRLSGFLAMLLFVSGFAECYKPVTKNQLPKHIRTVAVPAFQNDALRIVIALVAVAIIVVAVIVSKRRANVMTDEAPAPVEERV